MRADFAISGLLRQEVVALASCSAGKSRVDGHPSCRFIGVAISKNELRRLFQLESRDFERKKAIEDCYLEIEGEDNINAAPSRATKLKSRLQQPAWTSKFGCRHSTASLVESSLMAVPNHA
jgi:hypothetical protein